MDVKIAVASGDGETVNEHFGRAASFRIYRLIGSPREKVAVLSFVHRDRPTEEVGKFLDQHGISVRSGHHCAQPSLRRFGLEATVRPSFSFYNTFEEIDRMVAALKQLR